MPGAPGELGLGYFFACGVGGREGGDQVRDRFAVGGAVGGVGCHLASCAAPEEERAGDEVGGVEARGRERDDVFEDGGGADVDEGQQGGDQRHEADGDDGDRGTWFELGVGVSGKAVMCAWGMGGESITLLMKRWKGRPRSRAKDQIMRDAVARKPITAHQVSATTMDTMTVAPALDLTPL